VTWSAPRWASPCAMLLCVGGLGVSVYLTVAHYTTALTLACPDNATINCEKVTTSPESVVFGVPVALLGVAFFAVLLALNLPPAWHRPVPLLRLTRLSLTTSGIGFVVYLIYTELFTVHAICLWCTSAHAIAFLLFALTLFAETLASPSATQIGAVNAREHVTQARINP
jgi:uncharacterized membrane protein